MRGRPRKPTKQLEDTGAYDRHPERRAERENEPEPNGPIGAPPEYFDENHQAVWHEIIGNAAAGVLAKSDRIHLEIAVRLTVKMRLAPARMPKWLSMLGQLLKALGWDGNEIAEMQDAFRAAIGINGQELAILGTALTRMGMTPADRSRVNGEKPKPTEADPLTAAMQALTRGRQPIQ